MTVKTKANCCSWWGGGLIGAFLVLVYLLLAGVKGLTPLLACLGVWLLVTLMLMMIDFWRYVRSLQK